MSALRMGSKWRMLTTVALGVGPRNLLSSRFACHSPLKSGVMRSYPNRRADDEEKFLTNTGRQVNFIARVCREEQRRGQPPPAAPARIGLNQSERRKLSRSCCWLWLSWL